METVIFEGGGDANIGGFLLRIAKKKLTQTPQIIHKGNKTDIKKMIMNIKITQQYILVYFLPCEIAIFCTLKEYILYCWKSQYFAPTKITCFMVFCVE